VTAHVTAVKTISAPSKTKTVTVTKVKTKLRTVLRNQKVTEHNTVIKRIIFTTVLSIAFAILGCIGMLVGYWLGRKDQQRNEKHFLGSVLDSITSIGKREVETTARPMFI
jgi:hypothetical protein